jgi:hypothetical protein
MLRPLSCCLAGLLLLTAVAVAADKKTQIYTCKFVSYADGVLKATDLGGKDLEFKLDDDTDVVSVNDPKTKLPLKNAFTPINKGTGLRVFAQGDKVVAVQIAQNLPGPAGDNKATAVLTVKFDSYADGVLKVTDLDKREWEFKLDDSTDVVSVNDANTKLPLKNAFQPVSKGTILRVFTEGEKDKMKVVAVQIGQNAGSPPGDKKTNVLTVKFTSFADGVLKVTDLEKRDWEFKLDDGTDVVSVTDRKTKLPLKTAFSDVKPGTILRVFTEGEKDNMKVVAIQIGVN